MSKDIIHLLLIEDDPNDCMLIQEMVEKVVSNSLHFTYSELLYSGLKLLNKEKFDVLLLDLKLPDSRGFEAFQETHAIAPHIPIIILTALDDEELTIKAIQSGAQDYLVKRKLNGNLLLGFIRYAIERKKIEEALGDSEKRYCELFENAPVGIYHIALNGQILLVNPTLIAMLGYDNLDQLFKAGIRRDESLEKYSNKQIIERVEKENELKGLETTWKKKDNTMVNLLFILREILLWNFR